MCFGLKAIFSKSSFKTVGRIFDTTLVDTWKLEPTQASTNKINSVKYSPRLDLISSVSESAYRQINNMYQ